MSDIFNYVIKISSRTPKRRSGGNEVSENRATGEDHRQLPVSTSLTIGLCRTRYDARFARLYCAVFKSKRG